MDDAGMEQVALEETRFCWLRYHIRSHSSASCYESRAGSTGHKQNQFNELKGPPGCPCSPHPTVASSDQIT